MSGIGHNIADVEASGDPRIDGILNAHRWDDSTIFFSTPASDSEYEDNYGYQEHLGFVAASPQMQLVLNWALDTSAGTAADDGFSVEGFTGQNFQVTTAPGAHVRLAQTTSDPFNFGTAWGYFPSVFSTSGDVWMTDLTLDYSNPVAGSYAYSTLLHEVGHALGLAHGHDVTTHGVLPAEYDAMEYSVMSYRSYPNASGQVFTNELWGFGQTFMMQDIAALQYLYGANFTTNSDDTVYSWAPYIGDTKVNGSVAVSPGDNRIFATVWDGGGIDTYDLSAYSKSVIVRLTPGESSMFSTQQLAELGVSVNKFASGNVYNALLYQDDPRSLIENAIGGIGDDILEGNRADNQLMGGEGRDELIGLQGSDYLVGQAGLDRLFGGGGADVLKGKNGNDRLMGGSGADVLWGNNGKDRLFGGKQKDTLHGGDHDDILVGGLAADALFGDAGSDVFRFVNMADSKNNASFDTIHDFEKGLDQIDLSRLAAELFSFGGTDAFSASGPSVHYQQKDGNTQVLVDVTGNGDADMRIDLVGLYDLDTFDFIL